MVLPPRNQFLAASTASSTGLGWLGATGRRGKGAGAGEMGAGVGGKPCAGTWSAQSASPADSGFSLAGGVAATGAEVEADAEEEVEAEAEVIPDAAGTLLSPPAEA